MLTGVVPSPPPRYVPSFFWPRGFLAKRGHVQGQVPVPVHRFSIPTASRFASKFANSHTIGARRRTNRVVGTCGLTWCHLIILPRTLPPTVFSTGRCVCVLYLKTFFLRVEIQHTTILNPTEIRVQGLWSQTPRHRDTRVHCKGIRRVDSAMPCRHTGYDEHNPHTPVTQMHQQRKNERQRKQNKTKQKSNRKIKDMKANAKKQNTKRTYYHWFDKIICWL